MKLYARTTSERASKGQGGNKEISIDLFVGSASNSVKIAEIILKNEGNDEYSLYASTLTLGEDNQSIDAFIELKDNGEKEKGELKASDLCPNCNIIFGDCNC